MQTTALFAYNPLHLIVARRLEEQLGSDQMTLVYTARVAATLPALGIEAETIEIPDVSTSQPLARRVRNTWRAFARLRGRRWAAVWSPNELAPVSRFLNARTDGALVLYDEGFLYGAVEIEQALSRYRTRTLVRALATLQRPIRRFTSPNLARLLTFSPDQFGSRPFEVASLTDFLGDLDELVAGDADARPQTLLLTSPLTENGNAARRGQELDLVQTLVERNPGIDFVLKRHYREADDKYASLRALENFEDFDEAHAALPIQVVPLRFARVIGLHSSALLAFEQRGATEVLSLSNHVGTQHARTFIAARPAFIRDVPEDFVLDGSPS